MAAFTAKSCGLLTALIAIFVYVWQRTAINLPNERLDLVLKELLRAEKEVSLPIKPKIAVGFGGCQDLVVPAVDVLKYPADIPTFQPEHHDVITTKRELQETFGYFFKHGAAAERFIRNREVLEELLKKAKPVPGAKWALGGNAPIMGSRFAREGSSVLLGASLSKHLRKGLPDDIEVTGDELESDDVHISLEYQTGAVWGPLTTPRANRFIVHSDHNNPNLAGLDSFEARLQDFKPHLLVISGLQMMDNFPFPPGERESRLSRVQNIMVSQPISTRIHFEMASFSDESLLKNLSTLVMPYADSLGMNEQELTNLVTILYYGNISTVSDARPRIASVLDQMRELFRYLRKSTDQSIQRPITRLHVHTLAYQAIMTTKISPWKNSRSAAAKAALTANRHTCGSVDIDVSKANLLLDDSFSISTGEGSKRIPFEPGKPVMCWDEKDEAGKYEVEICLAPVLVCKKVVQTVGGGDNISSAGLVLQLV